MQRNWTKAATGLFILPGGQYDNRPVVAMVCGRKGEWVWQITTDHASKFDTGTESNQKIAMASAAQALDRFWAEKRSNQAA